MNPNTRPLPAVALRASGLSALAFATLVFPAAFAQSATGSATAPAPKEEVITLSTFQVTTSADKGYRAGNSVSATRIDTPIKDLPFSISAFTEQFINDIGARELMDIVAYAPGVTSGAKEFTQGNNRYSIRGFDGDVTPQRNGFVGNRYVDAGNIQRVEVVKGPSSLLYGQITPGGTVNYITKRANYQDFALVRQQVGSHDFLRTDIDVNHTVADGRFSGRVVAAYEKGFEWAELGSSESTLVAPSFAWKVTKNSNLIVDAEFYRRNEDPLVGMMPNLAVSVAANATNFPNLADRARAQAYVDVGNLNLGFIGYPPVASTFNYVGAGDYRHSDFDSLNVEYNIQLGTHWNARANYGWNKFYLGNKLTGLAEFTVTPAAAYLATKNRFDYVAELRANPGTVLADPTKTATALMTRRKRLEESFGHSNSYQAELAGNLEFGGVTVKPLFGAFLTSQRSGARRRESSAAPAAGVLNQNTTNTQHFQPWNYNDPATWDRSPYYDETALPFNNLRTGKGTDSALYGLLNLGLLEDRLIVIGGARYNKTESDGANMLPTLTGGNPVLDAPFEATKTTPQFGAGFKVRPDVLLFASYSESFFIEERNLTLFNPAFNPAIATNAATNPVTINAPALPTTGKGYEFGVKTDLFEGRVSSTLSWFHLERQDRVLRFRETVSTFEGQQFPTITRQGTVDESEGFEFEITWSPLDNWQVYATYTDMDIRTTKATFPTIPTYSADPAVQAAYVAAYNEATGLILNAVPEGSAERLASLWTRYTFTNDSLKNFWVGGGLVYTGEKAQRTANPTLFFESYTLYDLALGYDWKGAGAAWSGSISWKNVTDKTYYPANQARGLPERVVVSVSAKF